MGGLINAYQLITVAQKNPNNFTLLGFFIQIKYLNDTKNGNLIW